MKKQKQLLPVFTAVVIVGVALTGCSSIIDQIPREKSHEFTSAQDLARNWNQPVAWLPSDATLIKTREAAAGSPAILAATTDAELDGSQCAETDRQSAPTFSDEWSPENVYVDRVFACGDWAVIKTDSGWFGWTPNDPDEKAVSPAQ
jgi:uncharacterized protein YceK